MTDDPSGEGIPPLPEHLAGLRGMDLVRRTLRGGPGRGP